MDSTRRAILSAGVAAAAAAAVPRLFAQQTGKGASFTKEARFASTTRRPVPVSLSCCFRAAA